MTNDKTMLIQECDEILQNEEKHITIDYFNHCYTVYKPAQKNGKPVLKKIFGLECDTESFVDHVKYIIWNDVQFAVESESADKLLNKVQAMFEKQKTKVRKKYQKAVKTTKKQTQIENMR